MKTFILVASLLFFGACEAPMGDDGCQELTECYEGQDELRTTIANLNDELQEYLVSIAKLTEINSEHEFTIQNYQTKLDSLNNSLAGKIILPREQVELLLTDAEKLLLVLKESTIKDSIIVSNTETIAWQDSTISLLKNQIALKDSLFNDLKAVDLEKDEWYQKYLYAVVAFFSGMGINSLTN